MIIYLPKEFYAKSKNGILEHYCIEYNKKGMPVSMKVYQNGEYVTMQAKYSSLAGCTHVSFGKIFFLYDEDGNILRHSMLNDYNYCNLSDANKGIVEYTYSHHDHSVTKNLKSPRISLTKFITENPATIKEYVGRYQLCGYPQTRVPKKLVITNGTDNGNTMNNIKVMFGVYDSITYFRYPQDPKRLIVRKTVNGEVVIINNTVAVLDDMDILDNYQNLVMTKPDNTFERYIVFKDDDFEKDIKSVMTFNDQGHCLVHMGKKDIHTKQDIQHCAVYSVWQQLEYSFYNTSAILCDLDLSMFEEFI